MRRAFIADTEYQTFNMLHYYNHLEEKDDADFFLCDFFSSARMIFQRISYEFPFSKRILFAPHGPFEHESRIHWYLRHAGGYLFPKRTVKKSILEGDTQYTGYDEIYASTMTMFVVCLLQLNHQAKFYMIDEGISGYAGDPLTGHLSWRQKLFTAVFRRGAAAVKPECVFMYQIENAKKHTNLPIKEMPNLNEEFLEKVRRVFKIEGEEKSCNAKLIWLTHPDELERGTESTDKKVSDFLQKYKNHIMVRQHPRDARDYLYQGFLVDYERKMWELEIPLLNIENTTLIGAFSTAQMTPKMLYNLEPRVLFLCPLYKENYGRELYANIQQAIYEFKALYKHPERIIMIENLDKLQEVLETLL